MIGAAAKGVAHTLRTACDSGAKTYLVGVATGVLKGLAGQRRQMSARLSRHEIYGSRPSFLHTARTAAKIASEMCFPARETIHAKSLELAQWSATNSIVGAALDMLDKTAVRKMRTGAPLRREVKAFLTGLATGSITAKHGDTGQRLLSGLTSGLTTAGLERLCAEGKRSISRTF